MSTTNVYNSIISISGERRKKKLLFFHANFVRLFFQLGAECVECQLTYYRLLSLQIKYTDLSLLFSLFCFEIGKSKQSCLSFCFPVGCCSCRTMSVIICKFLLRNNFCSKTKEIYSLFFFTFIINACFLESSITFIFEIKSRYVVNHAKQYANVSAQLLLVRIFFLFYLRFSSWIQM